jgi:hypothetical protein
MKNFFQKWAIAIKLLPIVILIAVLKFVSHKSGWEVMELNALFFEPGGRNHISDRIPYFRSSFSFW